METIIEAKKKLYINDVNPNLHLKTLEKAYKCNKDIPSSLKTTVAAIVFFEGLCEVTFEDNGTLISFDNQIMELHNLNEVEKKFLENKDTGIIRKDSKGNPYVPLKGFYLKLYFIEGYGMNVKIVRKSYSRLEFISGLQYKHPHITHRVCGSTEYTEKRHELNSEFSFSNLIKYFSALYFLVTKINTSSSYINLFQSLRSVACTYRHIFYVDFLKNMRTKEDEELFISFFREGIEKLKEYFKNESIEKVTSDGIYINEVLNNKDLEKPFLNLGKVKFNDAPDVLNIGDEEFVVNEDYKFVLIKERFLDYIKEICIRHGIYTNI